MDRPPSSFRHLSKIEERPVRVAVVDAVITAMG